MASRNPAGEGVIQRLMDTDGKEITKGMVEVASIKQLGIWVKLDAERDDEVYPLTGDLHQQAREVWHGAKR